MIAEALRKEGQIDKAIGIYEEALEIDPVNAPVHAGLGIALYQRGRFRAAVDSMARALDLMPDLPYAVSLRLFSGHSLRELGDVPAASGQYELAVEVAPGNREALNHLATGLSSSWNATRKRTSATWSLSNLIRTAPLRTPATVSSCIG